MLSSLLLGILLSGITKGEVNLHHPSDVKLTVAEVSHGISVETGSYPMGRAQVWGPISSIKEIENTDSLIIRMQNTGVPLQISVVYRTKGNNDYHIRRIIVSSTEGIQTFKIALNSNMKLYAPNVIERMKSGTDASVIVHFQNAEDGAIKFILNEISLKEVR